MSVWDSWELFVASSFPSFYSFLLLVFKDVASVFCIYIYMYMWSVPVFQRKKVGVYEYDQAETLLEKT